jgi:hypothetical protein
MPRTRPGNPPADVSRDGAGLWELREMAEGAGQPQPLVRCPATARSSVAMANWDPVWRISFESHGLLIIR